MVIPIAPDVLPKHADKHAKKVCHILKLIVMMFVAILVSKMDLGKMEFTLEFIETSRL
jgi:hypothetical protein